MIVFAIRAVCAGNIGFDGTKWASLLVGVRLKGELTSEDRHMELFSAERAEAIAASGVTIDDSCFAKSDIERASVEQCLMCNGSSTCGHGRSRRLELDR